MVSDTPSVKVNACARAPFHEHKFLPVQIKLCMFYFTFFIRLFIGCRNEEYHQQMHLQKYLSNVQWLHLRDHIVCPLNKKHGVIF
jgi:hypothetical protein